MSYSEKIITIFNKFYQVLMYNFLFLVCNSLLFQFYFYLDFNIMTLPLFAFSSLTVLPSVLALSRTIDSVSIKQYSDAILKIFLRNLHQGLKQEWLYYLVITFGIHLFIFNLYCLSGETFFQKLLFLCNLILIIFCFLFIMVMLGTSRSKGKELVNSSLKRMGKLRVLNWVVLVSILFITMSAFRLSYLSILYIFGLALVGIVYYFRKVIDYGISD